MGFFDGVTATVGGILTSLKPPANPVSKPGSGGTSSSVQQRGARINNVQSYSLNQNKAEIGLGSAQPLYTIDSLESLLPGGAGQGAEVDIKTGGLGIPPWFWLAAAVGLIIWALSRGK